MPFMYLTFFAIFSFLFLVDSLIVKYYHIISEFVIIPNGLILVTTVTTGGGVLFRTENMSFRSILAYIAKFGYFVAYVRIFWANFLHTLIVRWCTKIDKCQV